MNSDHGINLSYVLTTFNKLKYLKVTLPDLIAACGPDEEIVVFDGYSTDGTREYLHELFSEGKIHQFVSEKDKGEAHGYNKAMLAAKGTLIKIISDDDAYDYNAIRRCKEFMLDRPALQLVAADGFGVNNLLQTNQFDRRNAVNNFKQWQRDRTPFIFCGLSIILRKDAIPLLGLWDCNYLIIDFEYSLRASASKAKLGWYTGLFYVNIVNANSNSGTQWRRMEIEKEKLTTLYFGRRPLISFRQKDRIKNLFRPLKRKLFKEISTQSESYESIYSKSMELLRSENQQIQATILT